MRGKKEKRFLYVFIGAIPEGEDIPEVASVLRREYLSRLSNPKRARESAYVWRLLELGVERTLGLSPDAVNYRRDTVGRWEADGFCLSISHTEGVCAAAISDSPVGVDIELIRHLRAESFPRRTLTESEYAEYEAKEGVGRVEFLIRKWTEKESAFKAGAADRVVQPGQTVNIPVRSERVELLGGSYSLSVCSESLDMLSIVYINEL